MIIWNFSQQHRCTPARKQQENTYSVTTISSTQFEEARNE
jgi:hypothetical protein